MYRKCVTEISIRHQKQVERSLLELMQKMHYEDISVTTLCHHAGITRRTFYHLFNSKTDALYAMIDHIILEAESYCSQIRDEALRFFRFWKDHRNLLDALRESNLSSILLERVITCVLNEDYDIRYWLRRNGWEEEKDIIVFNVSGVMALVFRWYYSDFQESPEEMAALLKKIISRPLAPNE